MNQPKKLKQLLSQNKILIAPGVFDGLSARLVEQAGFDLIYASGGAIARASGVPDIGLLSFKEVVDHLSQITEVTNIPIIADADTGFGNAVNVFRTVKTYENIGIAGLHLEDQTFPKRCGHLDDKTLISVAEMMQKIKTAVNTRTNPDFLIIARTDAIAAEGFDQAIQRAKNYLQAGADMIFVEAPETEKQIELIAKAIPQPKLINMFFGGKTPLIPLEKLEKLGFKLVIIPSDLQRAAIFAMQKTLAEIKNNGDSRNLQNQLTSFQERENIIGTKSYLSLDK